ncbi:hypothetical protein BCU70_02430 [Vibrio sp. 10N.286.49.C2]|uniref:LysR family transcriptional regulator n=1 Tax=unclassified Vibrio TaxID=2614977 RepID=UPI000C864365|nr:MULTISPECIES: LysR family transcriptional regulator [unclassified Vibrio]PMH38157.1 hypothetical protein BCU70_02430 [Vibrio sp. 10N.286.49.C2]PMH53637.1 hypothetical protein BCU66_12405 [Vibrio sp. 10N.286.49.B1]
MDLNLIKVFYKVYQYQSISKAAEELDVTAAAISQSLAKLKSHFNDPLFVRSGRGIVPTALAHRKFSSLSVIYDELMLHIEEEVLFTEEKSKRNFRIMSSSAIDLFLFPALDNYISSKCNDISFEVLPAPDHEEDKFTAIRMRNIDFALTLTPPYEQGFQYIEVISTHYCVVLNENHPRVKDSITIDQYFSENHISIFNKQHKTRRYDVFMDNEISYRKKIKYETKDIISGMILAAKTELLMIAPDILLRVSTFPGLKKLPLPMKHEPSKVYLVWSNATNEDTGAIWFRELVKNLLANLNTHP